MSISSWFHKIETEAGVIKIDINAVIGKLIAGVSLVAHEADALLKWGVSQSANISAGLNAAAPIISALAGLATTAATGNAAAGLVVTRAVNSVDAAFAVATASVKALDAAKASIAASGGGSLSSDTEAVVAGINTITTANSHVAAVSAAALAAAQAIQAVIPPKAAPSVAAQ